jgi:multiple sugar transport system substrate-binding protein
MKYLKSLMMVSIVLVLIFQLGCGSATNNTTGEVAKNDSKEKINLTFWDMHDTKEKEFFEGLVNEYNSIQDEVEIEYSTHNQGDYTTTILPTAFANDAGPDIYMISPGDFMKFADAGIMEDLTPYFPAGAKEDFLPASLDAVTVNGEILALPYELELLGLYYNSEMLENANVAVPQTWEELQEAARILTTDKIAGLVLPPDKGPYFNFIWYPFLWQLGGDVLSADGSKSTFNSPEAAQALEFWGSFFKEGSSPAKLQQGPWEIAHLGEGTAAMQVIGTWAIKAIEEQFSDVPIEVAPLPIPAGGKPATDAGGWKLAVNGESDHAAEAAAFVMWAFAEDTSRALEWTTEIKFAYSPRKSVIAAGEEIYSQGLRKVFTEQIYDSAIPEPRYPAAVMDAVGDAMQNVMFNNMSGADAAEAAHKKLTDVIKK